MRPCRFLLFAFILAYLLALALFVIGTFGLFGQETDPLSAIFVVLLGQPWVSLAEHLPETLHPSAALLSPLLTIGLLAALCRWMGRPSRG